MGKKGYVSTFKNIFARAYHASALNFLSMYVLFVIHGALFAYIIKYRGDYFNQVVDTGSADYAKQLLIGLLLLVGLEIVTGGVMSVAGYFAEVFDIKMIYEMNRVISEKATRIRSDYFEDPEFLDVMDKGLMGARSSMQFLNITMDMAFMYFPKVLFVSIYMVTLDWRLLVCMLLLFAPIIISQRVMVNIHRGKEEELAILRRRLMHYEEALMDRKAYKETLILGAQVKMTKLSLRLNEQIQERIRRAKLKGYKLESFSRSIKVIGYVAILVYMTVILLDGGLSIGDFISIFFALERINNELENGLVNRMKGFADHYVKIENYFKFMELEEEAMDGEHTAKGRVEVKGLSYKYPGTDHYALKDVSFNIDKGETIAVVGANGSGKSTLSKLINGNYQASEGEVLWDGKKRSSLNNSGVTQLFQKFNRYHMTIEENLKLGDYKKDMERDKVKDQLAEYSFDCHKFDGGEQAMLSKEFGGIDISGGEWQRLAMARTYHKEHNLLILDEPTAAIDPINENQLYRIFLDSMKEKTGVIITHRLATCKYVDKVLVLDKGKVAGYDHHDVLVKELPLYEEMWSRQAEFYA